MAVTYAWRLDANKFAYILSPEEGLIGEERYGYVDNHPLIGEDLTLIAQTANEWFGEDGLYGYDGYTKAYKVMVNKAIEKWPSIEFADLLTADEYYNVDSSSYANLRGAGVQGIRFLGVCNPENWDPSAPAWDPSVDPKEVDQIQGKYSVYGLFIEDQYDNNGNLKTNVTPESIFAIYNGLKGGNGGSGGNGNIPDGPSSDDRVSSVTVMAFKHSETQPYPPTGGSVNFTTGKITYPNGWSDGEFEKNPIWQSTRVFFASPDLVSQWTTPICVSVDVNGGSGVGIEYMYQLSETYLKKPSAPPTNQINWNPSQNGWKEKPQGVTPTMNCEWVITRKMENGNWSKWDGPILWSKWGEKGQDGNGVEYVYYLNDGATPASPTPSNWATNTLYQDTTKEYKPSGSWTDEPKGVNSTQTVEWVCVRKYGYWYENGELQSEDKKWLPYSEPSVWAHYGEKGDSGLSIRTLYAMSDKDDAAPKFDEYANPDDQYQPWDYNFPTDYDSTKLVWAIDGYIDYNGKLQGKWQGPRLVTGVSGKVEMPTYYTSTWYAKTNNNLAPNKPSTGLSITEIYSTDTEGNRVDWLDFPNSNGTWYQCVGKVNSVTNIVIEWGIVSPWTGKDGEAKEGNFWDVRVAVTDSYDTKPRISKHTPDPNEGIESAPWILVTDKTTITVPEGGGLWETRTKFQAGGEFFAEGIDGWCDPYRINGERGPQGDTGPASIVPGPAGLSYEERFMQGYEDSPKIEWDSALATNPIPNEWTTTIPPITNDYPYIWCIKVRKNEDGDMEPGATWEGPFRLTGINGTNGIDATPTNIGVLTNPADVVLCDANGYVLSVLPIETRLRIFSGGKEESVVDFDYEVLNDAKDFLDISTNTSTATLLIEGIAANAPKTINIKISGKAKGSDVLYWQIFTLQKLNSNAMPIQSDLGNDSATLPAEPEGQLLVYDIENTFNIYVGTERKDIDEIFLSDKTGKKIDYDGITADFEKTTDNLKYTGNFKLFFSEWPSVGDAITVYITGVYIDENDDRNPRISPFRITRLRNGKDSVWFQLALERGSIVYDRNDAKYIPTGFTVGIQKNTVDGVTNLTVTQAADLGYKIYVIEDDDTEKNHLTTDIIDIANNYKDLEERLTFELCDNEDNCIDREIVPLLTNGLNGTDGFSIVWKGEHANENVEDLKNPKKNWCYKNTTDGKVYIFDGSYWTVMTESGGTIWVTYCDNEWDDEPETPPADGEGGDDNWHLKGNKLCRWMCQKVAASITEGTWGDPIMISGISPENFTLHTTVDVIQYDMDGNNIVNIEPDEKGNKWVNSYIVRSYNGTQTVIDNESEFNNYLHGFDFVCTVDNEVQEDYYPGTPIRANSVKNNISFELRYEYGNNEGGDTGTKDMVWDHKTVYVVKPKVGQRGQLVYPAGIYNVNKVYETTETKAPYVLDSDGRYYVLNAIMKWVGEKEDDVEYPMDVVEGGAGWRTPSENYNGGNNEEAYWEPFEMFEAIYSDIGVFNQMLVGSAVFYGDYVFSQQSVDKRTNFEDFDVDEPFSEKPCRNWTLWEKNTYVITDENTSITETVLKTKKRVGSSATQMFKSDNLEKPIRIQVTGMHSTDELIFYKDSTELQKINEDGKYTLIPDGSATYHLRLIGTTTRTQEVTIVILSVFYPTICLNFKTGEAWFGKHNFLIGENGKTTIGNWNILKDSITATNENGNTISLVSDGTIKNSILLGDDTEQINYQLNPDGSADFSQEKVHFGFEGDGYVANKNIEWDKNGNLTVKGTINGTIGGGAGDTIGPWTTIVENEVTYVADGNSLSASKTYFGDDGSFKLGGDEGITRGSSGNITIGSSVTFEGSTGGGSEWTEGEIEEIVKKTEIDGGNIKTGTLNADRISGGTIDAKKVDVINLDAGVITTGVLSADRISGGTIKSELIDVDDLTVKKLNTTVTGKKNNIVISGNTFNAYNGSAQPSLTVIGSNFDRVQPDKNIALKAGEQFNTGPISGGKSENHLIFTWNAPSKYSDCKIQVNPVDVEAVLVLGTGINVTVETTISIYYRVYQNDTLYKDVYELGGTTTITATGSNASQAFIGNTQTIKGFTISVAPGYTYKVYTYCTYSVNKPSGIDIAAVYINFKDDVEITSTYGIDRTDIGANGFRVCHDSSHLVEFAEYSNKGSYMIYSDKNGIKVSDGGLFLKIDNQWYKCGVKMVNSNNVLTLEEKTEDYVLNNDSETGDDTSYTNTAALWEE